MFMIENQNGPEQRVQNKGARFVVWLPMWATLCSGYFPEAVFACSYRPSHHLGGHCVSLSTSRAVLIQGRGLVFAAALAVVVAVPTAVTRINRRANKH